MLKKLPPKIDLSKEVKMIKDTWNYCDSVEINTSGEWMPWMKTKDFQDIIQHNLDAEGIKKSSAQVLISTPPNDLLKLVKEIDKQSGEKRNISAWRIKCRITTSELVPKE